MRLTRSAAVATLVLALLATPLAGETQTTAKIHRVGLIKGAVGFDPDRNTDDKAFVEGLRESGFIVGQNVVIEWRSAYGQFDRYAEIAADLVRLQVDVIYGGATPGALAARNATDSIPILTVSAAPVESGLGASLAGQGATSPGSRS